MDQFRPRFLGQVALRGSFLGVTPQDDAHAMILSIDQYMGFKNDLGDVQTKNPWVTDPNYVHYDAVKALLAQISGSTSNVEAIRAKWSDPALTSLSDDDRKAVYAWENAVADLRNLVNGGYINKNSVPAPVPIQPTAQPANPAPATAPTPAPGTPIPPLPLAPTPEPPSNILPVAAGVGLVTIIAIVGGGIFGK